jgi:putative colanic acid biosynthesis UDP-glucose lipid carrier transferase
MNYRGIIREHSVTLNAIFRNMDLAVVVFSGISAYWIHFGNLDLPDEYLSAVVIAALLTLIVFPHFNIYGQWRGTSIAKEIEVITFAWMSVLILLSVFGFVTKQTGFFSRIWIGYWFIAAWWILIAERITLRTALSWLRKKGFNQRHVIIVGGTGIGGEVASTLMASPWLGLRVLGCFCDGWEPKGEMAGKLKVLGGLDAVAAYVAENKVDQVWITLPLKEEEAVKKLLYQLRHSTADIRFVPDIFGFRLLNHSISEIVGIPVINLRTTPMEGVHRWVKALEDRVLALLILLLISPLMLIIAAAVKVSSPGPVFFKQLRHGWDGRSIKVYKFRTMQVHNESAGTVTQATLNDPRVTRLGAILRRTSLDELPQFINVIQGRMSIVGPRPHAIEHNEHFKNLVDDYMLRHKVKPGITGWAQIHGWRGETDTLEKMQKRVEYDLYYIENWSVWLDIKIILLTLFKGFVHRNAY